MKHLLTFRFQCSNGPSDWTEEMARKGALFCWALKKWNEQIEGVTFETNQT
jgi:hypothetical protein